MLRPTLMFAIVMVLSLPAQAHRRRTTKIPTIAMATASGIEVCSIPLPGLRGGLNLAFMGLTHVYLKINGITYGTPYAANGGILGGYAALYSDDPLRRDLFELKAGATEECYPVQRPEAQDDAVFNHRLQCVAKKLAMPYKLSGILRNRDWLPFFDYNVLDNNCTSMSRYLLRCVGGRFDRSFNYTVGDVIPDQARAFIAEGGDARTVSAKPRENHLERSTYGDVCRRAIRECDAEVEVTEEEPGPEPDVEATTPEPPPPVDE